MNEMDKADSAFLRQKAEDLLKTNSAASASPFSEAESLRLIHELEVHQIELEMINEELRIAWTEAELANEKYIRLYDFAPSGYFTLSQKGEILELNLSGAKMLDKDRQHLKNSLFDYFVSVESKPIFWLFLEKVFQTMSIVTCEVKLQENGNIPIHLLLKGVNADNQELCYVDAVDITERKQAFEEIKLKNDELQKLNAEKDKFFSIIAHDLRGPLGVFMQLTELLADKELGISADQVSEMIDDMSKSARNTFNLLENLLEWSQISRGHSEFNPQRIDLKKVATESIKILTEQARGKGIELVDKIINETEVIADKNMLQSVIRNLLSNAIKFTRKGGKITISAKTAENNQILVSVEDTGIGMTEDLRNNLFRIDSNTKRAGTQGEKSAGLGLLLCKEFVEKQGGKISFESEEEVGSVFSFTVPFAVSPQKKNAIEIVVSDDNQRRTLKNLNILIAEDDEITAKIISIMVKGISSQVFRAKTGGEAVEICRNHPEIDLVIMDIKMPLMNGYDATRQIREFNPKIVILAESTFTMPSDLEIAIEAGCNDYLLKPFTWEVFERMIQKYVRK